MNFDKDQKTMLAITVLIIVCLGSFLGIRLMSDSVPDASIPQSVITTTNPTTLPTAPPTTEPTTTAPTTTEPTTTAPTTTAPTTTAPTTTKTTVQNVVPSTEEPTVPPQIVTKPQNKPSDAIGNAALFDKGFLSYKYSPDGNYYYTNDDPWQRYLGYTEGYDIAAPFVIIFFDTIRVKFEYDNKDWMVQFWKGQYGYVFIGAEIGVYTKPKSRTNEFYDCASDEDALYMSMICYRDGNEIFRRKYSKYWWCTGFVPGKLDSFQDRSELTVESRITLKDYKMLLAFTGALKNLGYNLGEDFTTKGLDVHFTWTY